jgi:hypothetical protein
MNTNKQQLTVSAQTRNFLECIILADELYGKVFSALAELYDETRANKIIMEEYSQMSLDLQNVIKDFMFLSIEDNISSNDFAEI